MIYNNYTYGRLSKDSNRIQKTIESQLLNTEREKETPINETVYI